MSAIITPPRSFSFLTSRLAFEIKYDGFRSIARVEQGRCNLISRNGNEFKSFRSLGESLADELRQNAVLDGEIVCLGSDGKAMFYDLLLRRDDPRFVAFDLLHCNGEDLRYSSLIERKHRLRSILPTSSESILYCDHVDHAGEELFALACENDLEGVVAKLKYAPYLQEQAQWVKIRNMKYSQWEGREEFFEREREIDPDTSVWDGCVLACEDVSL